MDTADRMREIGNVEEAYVYDCRGVNNRPG